MREGIKLLVHFHPLINTERDHCFGDTFDQTMYWMVVTASVKLSHNYARKSLKYVLINILMCLSTIFYALIITFSW